VEGLEPSFSLRLPVPRSYHTRRRGPGKGHTIVLGCVDVKGPIWDYRKRKARPRPDSERPHASRMAVVEDERLDPGHLLESPDPPEQVPACQCPPIQGDFTFRRHLHTPLSDSRAFRFPPYSLLATFSLSDRITFRPPKEAKEGFRPSAGGSLRRNGPSAPWDPCPLISSARAAGITVAREHFPLEEPSLADKIVNSLSAETILFARYPLTAPAVRPATK
jgi:hypothetical protein